MSSKDTPGVLAPPPLIFATALVLGWLLGRVVPQPVLPGAIAAWAGCVLTLAARAGAHRHPLYPAGT